MASTSSSGVQMAAAVASNSVVVPIAPEKPEEVGQLQTQSCCRKVCSKWQFVPALLLLALTVVGVVDGLIESRAWVSAPSGAGVLCALVVIWIVWRSQGLADLETQVQTLSQHNKELGTQVQTLQGENQKFATNNQTYEKQIAELQAQIKKLEVSKKQLEGLIGKFETSLGSITGDFEKQLPQFHEILGGFQRELAEISGTSSSLATINESIERTTRGLSAFSELANKFLSDKIIQDRIQKQKELTQNNDRLVKTQTELVETQTKMSQNILALQNQETQVTARVAAKTQEEKSLKASIEQLKVTIEQLRKTKESLDNVADRLHDEVTELDERSPVPGNHPRKA